MADIMLREKISNELLRFYGEPLILDAVREIETLIASVANEVIDKPHIIYLTKNPDGTIDMKDDVVAHWDYLRARQHEQLAKLLNQSEGEK